MEEMTLPIIAASGSLVVILAMAAKAWSELAPRRLADDAGDILSLSINGKDFSVDLKSISNGGSERIHEAVRELEHCA